MTVQTSIVLHSCARWTILHRPLERAMDAPFQPTSGGEVGILYPVSITSDGDHYSDDIWVGSIPRPATRGPLDTIE